MTFLHLQDIQSAEHDAWAQHLTARMGKQYRAVNADEITQLKDPDGFSDWLQTESIDLVMVSCENEKRIIQGYLNAFRTLRIPYIFITDTMKKMSLLAHYETALMTILAPVTMLEEEVHKAEIIGHLIRYTGCRAVLMQPNDYGHRAEHNIGKIRTFLEHQQMQVEVIKASKDSMSMHRELPDHQKTIGPDMLILTASREYGLDDLFFGPAERHVISKAAVPVMLLNPRGDLFSLCD